MNFKEYLLEVGNSVTKPKNVKKWNDSTDVVYTFTVGDNDFRTTLEIKQRDVRVIIDVDFKLEDPDLRTREKYKLTGVGNPLEVIGSVVWCVLDHIKTLDDDLQLFVLTFTGKEEVGGDRRRRDIYFKFVDRNLKSRKIKDYEIKLFGADVEVHFKDTKMKDFK